jgi:hypothetical protein
MTTGRINQVTILTSFQRWDEASHWLHVAVPTKPLSGSSHTVAHADREAGQTWERKPKPPTTKVLGP